MRIIVGMSGATGAPIGIRVLEMLRQLDVETHLIISKWARTTIELESDLTVSQVRDLASFSYGPEDQAASISSGSFRTDGMVVAPCSMKSLSAIRHGYGENLIQRAADVVLKEQKKLVLVPRETPLNAIQLENMLDLVRLGVSMVPPMPAFYNRPESVDDIINHIAARILDQFGLDAPEAVRWAGVAKSTLGEKRTAERILHATR
jgi:4-hydroxy-3-polyprenylbenzoate decarboxylase